MVIGFLPSLGGSIRGLAFTGQEKRLTHIYMAIYTSVFDKIYYFSYDDEKTEDWIQDPALAAKVVICGNRLRVHRLLYMFLMPFIYRRQMKECAILRVFQITGSVPGIIARICWGKKVAGTFGYRYSIFTRYAGHYYKSLIIAFMERIALLCVNAVIVTTDELLKYVRGVSAKAKILYIPNGVDLTVFTPQKRAVHSRWRILFAGRLEKQKNLYTLMDACALISGQHPVCLTLLGKGSEEKALRAYAAKKNVDCAFLPFVPHEKLIEYFRSHDLFVLPSWIEGHPKVLLEAMATGLPAIVSGCSGNSEVVEDGVSGILFDPRVSRELADAMKTLLSDPVRLEKTGEQAAMRIARLFDLRVLVNREARSLMDISKGLI